MKIPPHSIEAERGILGAILIDKNGIIQIANFIKPSDFYDPNHEIIFAAMIELFAKNRPIDILTLREVLDDQKKLDAIGGVAYLVELSDSIFTSTNVFQYAQIVKQKGVLRRLIKAGGDILSLGYEEAEETNSLLEKAEQHLF
jgi:replicative DNA helicase